MRRVERLGPVFKGATEGRLAVFVMGARHGRRLLRDRSEALGPVTPDMTSLVPGEFMRRMRGEDRRRPRLRFVAGLADLDMRGVAPRLRGIAPSGLRRHAAGAAEGAGGSQRWNDTISEIATDLLVRRVFGPSPGSSSQARLTEGLRRLGPNGVARTVGLDDAEASRGLLGRMRRRGAGRRRDDGQPDLHGGARALRPARPHALDRTASPRPRRGAS